MNRADGTCYYQPVIQRVETRCYNIDRAYGSKKSANDGLYLKLLIVCIRAQTRGRPDYLKFTMNKTTIYIILTLLKAILIITGMVFVFLNFISWRTTKDVKKLKKAAMIFGGVFLSILILTVIEFIIAFN
jgi:hypothetical protein